MGLYLNETWEEELFYYFVWIWILTLMIILYA